MRIYKNKDITTNIDTEKMSINNSDTYFYTEDKGSAALRIFINHRNTAFNLDNTNLKPVLDLFHTDGSIWLDEPLEVIMSDKGILQYNIPNNVIAHAGQIKAKLFLRNAEQSVHVANFTFDIKDSGIEGAVAKEISVNIVDDAVRRIVKENAIEILSDEYKEKINQDVVGYIASNPDKYKGKDGKSLNYSDLTTEQKEDLKSNITDEAINDFVLKDGIVTRSKISDEYLNNGMLANGTDTYLVKKVGSYMGHPDGGYLNLPVDFNPKKSFLLEVKTISSIWYMQILTDFSEPMNSWKRTIRINNDNVKNPWYRNYNLEGAKLNTESLADSYNFREILANNTDIDTIYKAGIYTCIGTNQYISIPEELKGRSFILKTYSGRADGAFNTQEITPMDDNSITFKRYRMYKTDKSEWAKYKAITNNNTNNNSTLPLEGKKIVMFGDSITENGTYPEQFAELSKAQVIKAGFGGCRMAQHQQAGTGLLYDKQCMYRLVDCIKNNDFTDLVQATEDMVRANGDDNRPQAFRLRDTDWNTVDYITIFFGTNDYGGDIPIGNNEDTDGTTFKGAVNKVIKTLGESVPHIKIMFITPFYRSRFISGDNKDGDNFANAAGAKLNDYVVAIEELAEKNHIPVLNMMKESGINKYNSGTYLSDGLHPNTFGYTYLAEQFSKKLPYKL
ncbi:BppU family phage baseplate upper protein [Staphylococcus shinii]|uniref:BppU family phage baseplate upper protein n=1 Tax=Staphylococcus shinii TaxID=2912228 RepID=UPI003517EFA9